VSLTRLPQLGSVVWAELEDTNGFRKVRPAVVVTATADLAAGKPVRVVAITTWLPTPLPDDHILLPWDRQGKARSGLRRRCAAVASWQATSLAADVQKVVGILPAAVIGELLTKVAKASTPLPPTLGVACPPAAGPSAEPPPALPPPVKEDGKEAGPEDTA
jgi:PemK-like, MazF-like toxin of type II toxin-antitoxin system